MNTLWVAIENKEETDNGVVSELVGVFDSEEKALSACHNDRCGIGPANLNEPMPVETVTWPGFYYPSESGESN